MADPENKTCLRCKQQLPLGEFHRDKNRKDGRYPYCRKCATADVKARTANPEWKAHKKAYDRARYERLREKLLLQCRANYERNRERALANAKAWVQRNPEKRRIVSQSYKHRRRSVEKAGMSWKELEAWKRSQPKKCHWCGKGCARGYVVDHYVALAKGGKHEASNLVISCRPCNARKSAKDPIDFARSIGRLL